MLADDLADLGSVELRHLVIENEEHRPAGLDNLKGFHAVATFQDFEALPLQRAGEQLPAELIVVNDEDGPARVVHWGRRMAAWPRHFNRFKPRGRKLRIANVLDASG